MYISILLLTILLFLSWCFKFPSFIISFLFRRTSFGQSFRVGLLVTIFLISLRMSWLFPSIPKAIFAEYRFLCWLFFSSAYENVVPRPLPPWFLMRNLLSFKFCFLSVKCHISLVLSRFIFLSLFFQKFDYVVISIWIYLGFSYLEFSQLLEHLGHVLCQTLGVFSHYFFEYFPSLTSLYFPFRTLMTQIFFTVSFVSFLRLSFWSLFISRMFIIACNAVLWWLL